MTTFLPQNQFISNSTVIPEPPAVEDPAVALSRTSVLDAQTGATAGTIQSSDGSVEGHAPLDGAKSAESGRHGGAQAIKSAGDRQRVAAVGIEPDPSDAIPMTNGGDQETPASAPSKNPDVGVLATDHIHEIFFYARKLLTDHPDFVGFVFDEERFMAEIEEVPLFIREDGYLKRQA